MDLRFLRAVAALDLANVMAVTALSGPHGAAAATGYAPALTGTLLVHTSPRYRRTARILCVLALIPNTLGSIGALDRSSRSRILSLYVGIGGVLLGFGYLAALRGPD